jgi:tight adherence protein B
MIDIPEFGFGVVVYVGIFLGVLLVFDGVWQLLSRTERVKDARNRRMRLIAGGASTGEILGLLKPAESRWVLSSIPLLGTLPQDMRQAGLTLRPGVLIAFSLTATVALAAILAMRFDLLLSVVVAVMIGIFAPVLVIRKIRENRMARLVAQLPDALDLMARGLRVGHPLNATISTVARDMIDPVATEFGIIVDQISYGDDLVEAFRDFAERVGLEDVRYLATSVAIQNGTGGDLSQILLTLAKVIRARITMRKRILAISSEGRLTAIFMSLLPVFIFGVTSLTSPTYYSGVSGDPLFRPVAITVVVLIVANYLAMRRLVNFRI